MTMRFNELLDFNETVFRNIQRVGFDEFDDLSTNSKARAFAHQLTQAADLRFNSDELHYHAIDFIFKQTAWLPSRFGNGNFPVWYGALDLKTSFYETIYHWQRTFLEAPQGFNQTIEKPIPIFRTVFKVNCQAAFIDLRNKAKQHRELVDPDPSHYPETQQIGQRMSREGYPGLITPSARLTNGETVAVFKKEILSMPVWHQDYCYEYNLKQNKKTVKQVGNDKVVMVI